MHTLMLRASGTFELKSVTDASIESGVEHGQEIRELVDATIQGRWDDLAKLRDRYEDTMGSQRLVDVLTVASGFNGITRVADATGIPVDAQPRQASEQLRAQVGIDAFDYSEKMRKYEDATSP